MEGCGESKERVGTCSLLHLLTPGCAASVVKGGGVLPPTPAHSWLCSKCGLGCSLHVLSKYGTQSLPHTLTSTHARCASSYGWPPRCWRTQWQWPSSRCLPAALHKASDPEEVAASCKQTWLLLSPSTQLVLQPGNG